MTVATSLRRVISFAIMLLWAGPVVAGELVFEGGGQLMEVASPAITDIAIQDMGQGLSRVDLVLSNEDAARFDRMTSQMVGEQLTMSVCGLVVAEPHIMNRITGGRIAITGGHEMMADVFDVLSTTRDCAGIGS